MYLNMHHVKIYPRRQLLKFTILFCIIKILIVLKNWIIIRKNWWMEIKKLLLKKQMNLYKLSQCFMMYTNLKNLI